MSVLNDYECKMHGVFEAFERKCPSGCSRRFVSQVFLKAPGTRSYNTARIDRELNHIAKDYGLTDIRAGKDDGESCMTKLGRDGKGTEWVNVPHAKAGWSQRQGETAPVYNIQTIGADPGATPGFKPGDFAPPVPKIVGTYNENTKP